MIKTMDVSVDIDTDELLSELSREDLVAELRRRDDSDVTIHESYFMYEKLLYALRDGDFEKAKEAAAPILEDKIGRIL